MRPLPSQNRHDPISFHKLPRQQYGNAAALAFAIGRGVNAGLSSRRAGGLALGFAAGFVIHHAFSHARAPAATALRDMCADVLAGYASGGGTAAQRNLVYGQATTLLGHLLGAITTQRAAVYEHEVYFYESAWWQPRGAISLGNVIVGPPGLRAGGWVKQHELAHRLQALVLGVLYIPCHVMAQALATFIDGSTHGRTNVLENALHPVPHDHRTPYGWMLQAWVALRRTMLR